MKLTLMVPGPTDGTRRSVFGGAGGLIEPEARRARPGTAVVCAPEPASVETAGTVAATTRPEVIHRLSGPDFGRWTGLSAEQVIERDAAGLQHWLRDPDARPHGGESLAGHLGRVAALLDQFAWPDAGAVIVASAFTVRAACVHALHAGAASLLHLDVAPGATATITRNGTTWRLRTLTR